MAKHRRRKLGGDFAWEDSGSERHLSHFGRDVLVFCWVGHAHRRTVPKRRWADSQSENANAETGAPSSSSFVSAKAGDGAAA
jgi:hypothetical protein